MEPRKGKVYESSLRAQAEVEVPEGETVERVEMYLNDTRVATLYQPPWVHPMVLPRGQTLSYVRAVAFLAEDHAAFEAARREVLARNPRYSSPEMVHYATKGAPPRRSGRASRSSGRRSTSRT